LASIARILLFLLALFAIVMPRAADALEVPELAERTKPSVVLVTIFDAGGRKLGTGTGFFVSEAGRLVTNFHVIDEARSATVTLDNGQVVKVAGVLARSSRDDLAVLQTDGSGPYPTLPLSDALLVAGQEVVVVGSPLGLSGTVSTGIVAAVRDRSPVEEDHDDHGASGESWRVQITAPISPGSSGSPILSRDGQVVAVAVGLRNGGQNLNFGIPVDRLRVLLGTLGDHPAVQSFAGPAPRSALLMNLGISAVVFLAGGIAFVVWQRRVRR
jgi:S1-C subfamily serine protease